MYNYSNALYILHRLHMIINSIYIGLTNIAISNEILCIRGMIHTLCLAFFVDAMLVY